MPPELISMIRTLILPLVFNTTSSPPHHLHRKPAPARTLVLVQRVKHEGYGNVLENGHPVRGFALKYERCSEHHPWPEGVTKVQTGPQEFLVPSKDPDDTRQTCDLQVSFKPYIYLVENGKISTFPKQNETR